jgi:hypothetical protein
MEEDRETHGQENVGSAARNVGPHDLEDAALGPLHGFGIARRLEQVSRDVLQLNEGTVDTALLRLQQQGWIAAEWGTSENNRKAKFYSITRRGRKQLEVENGISGICREQSFV